MNTAPVPRRRRSPQLVWSRASAVFGAMSVLALALAANTTPAAAVTQADVDAACASSSEALAAYRADRASFEEAAAQLEATRYELEETQLTVFSLEELIRSREQAAEDLEDRAVEAAVELYMTAGGDAITTVALNDPRLVAVASELLATATSSNIQTINDLTAARTDIEQMAVQYADVAVELAALEVDREVATARQEAAMSDSLAAYDKLDGECRQLQAEYEAEQARIRAEEAARRGSGGGGLPPGATPGFACPFTPGRTQFIDSWGFPRSGGRTHKGADMFAEWDEPVYAVANGTVAVEEHGIGGKHIWLSSDYGTAFYYAHLNGFAVSDGQQVTTGQLIGYNGTSGNAAGTSPHVHFQIHPSGRNRDPVNPYATVAAACL